MALRDHNKLILWYCHGRAISALFLCLGLFFLFLFNTPNFAQADDLVFSYTFDSPSIQKIGDQHRVVIPGLPTNGNPGEPVVPIKTVRILLPPGQDITEVQTLTPTKLTLPGSYHIHPGQFQAPLNQLENWQPIPGDEKIYSSSAPFPSQPQQLVGTWSLCGYRIAIVNLYPIEYIPLTGTISYFPQMELRLHTVESPKALSETQRMLRSPELLAPRLRNLVDNPGQIQAYHSITVSPRAPKTSLVGPAETYPYVIITDQDLKPAFQILAEFKTVRGQRAKVVTIQEIDAVYAGGDLPEQIRNFIIDAYTFWQTEYVLLGGDDEIVPHRGLYAEAFGYTDIDIASDLYFGALDGNWNTDGDQLWGEPREADLLPEVTVGRAPVANQEQTLHFVTKTMQYQQAPVLDQVTEAILVGEELYENPLTYGGDYKDEIRFGATTNSCTTTGFPPNFTVNTLYDRDQGSPWWGVTLLNLMNNGLHLINHVGHTRVDMALRLSADQVLDDLTNEGVNNAYFIIFTQGCYAASFDNRKPNGSYVDDCVAEAFVEGPHGAVAFVGNTRYGWASPGLTDGACQYFDRQFFDALFGEGITHLGLINDDSKIDNLWALDYQGVRWCYYQQTLLGDPELDLWTDVPGTLSVVHPTVVTIMEEDTITIRVESDEGPVANALVCIRQGDDIYATQLSDHLGEATFSLMPTTPDTLDISVTAHNHLPYLGTISARANGPWPWYSRHAVDDSVDDETSNGSGNQDGVINQGETIKLTVWLSNFGDRAAQGISATLRTADPYVEILDSVQTYPTILPEEEQTGQDSYLFTVSGACPDGHIIDFMVEARDGADGQWTSTFSAPVSAPQLVFENLNFYDDPPDGNQNGILEPGESAVLTVTVKNNGSATAKRVRGYLSTEGDPYVHVDRGKARFFTISPGSTARSRPFYKISTSGQSPPIYFGDYILNLSAAGGYTAIDSIPYSLGPTGLRDDMEDQETAWVHGGTGDLWHLSQTRVHSPFHAWYLGEAVHRQYQNGMDAFLLSPRIILVSGSVFTFWHWYDLEEDRDFGYVEMYTDSGWIPLGEPITGTSQGWIRETYDLSTYPSETSLQVRFRMTSDAQNCGEGWYIDDIYVGQPLRFTLDQAQVTPERGENSTVFTFSIRYISDQNYPPTTFCVYIDDTPHLMTTTDTDYTQGATFTYQTALDLGEHQHSFSFGSELQTTKWPRVGEYTGPLVAEAIYQEDFEDGDGGFVIIGPDWEWGFPTSGPEEAHSGQRVWATVLAGEYSDNSDARLETPPIDLTGVMQPQLSFWHWFSFEYRQAHYDGGNVKISSDGGEFQVLTPDNGYEGTINNLNAGIPGEPGFCSFTAGKLWHQETFDLSPYSDHLVVIRFHFGSDFSHTYSGWYIDDVAITGLRSGSLPAVSDLKVSLSGDDVQLSWAWPRQESPAGYIIYRGSFGDDTFTEPESIATVTDVTYTDSSAAGNPTVNYCYIVRALSLDGEKSDPSRKVGEFDITPH